MGWMEPHGPTAEENALRAATALAAAVRAWEAYPSMNNQEAMLDRLADYERILR